LVANCWYNCQKRKEFGTKKVAFLLIKIPAFKVKKTNFQIENSTVSQWHMQTLEAKYPGQGAALSCEIVKTLIKFAIIFESVAKYIRKNRHCLLLPPAV